ncbi:hypothetical protein JXI42_12765 [bacterium]|nr:hypothetical protein [bacterium]
MKKLLVITILLLMFSLGFSQDTLNEGTDSQAVGLSTPEDSSMLASVPVWEDLTIKAFVNKDSLPENDTLLLTVQVELIGNPDIYEFSEVEPPEVSHLDLISSASRNRSEVKNGKTLMYKEYLFYYNPISMGMAYINPVNLKYKHIPLDKTRTLQTSRIGIKVTEPLIPNDKSILPLIMLIVVAFTAGAAILIWVYFRNKKRKSIEVEESKPMEEELLTELKGTKKLLEAGDISDYFGSISQITRRYLREALGIEAMGIPTKELIGKLEELNVDDKLLDRTQRVLTVCDMVRFARHEATQLEKDDVYMNLEMVLTESLMNKSDENRKNET